MRSAAAVAERALSLAGSLAGVLTRPASSGGADVDGTRHDEPAWESAPSARPTPPAPPAPPAPIPEPEPWEGYRQLKAVDVIDRITGASAAELAAVELYETSSKRRRTVLAAVERERRATGA